MKFFRPVFLLVLFCFCCVSATASDELNKSKLDDISEVISIYLSGSSSKAVAKAGEFVKLYQEDDVNLRKPEMMVMEYLAGDKSVTSETIAFATEKLPDLWALASLGFFVRELAAENKPDRSKLKNYLANYSYYLQECTKDTVKKWKKPVVEWQAWVVGGCRSGSGLPKLLKTKSSGNQALISSTANIGNLTIAALKKDRKQFAKRPRPDNFSFNKKMLNGYLKTLPDEASRKNEYRRCKLVYKAKSYLVRLMRKFPYEGRIKLHKQTFTGTVSLANENILKVKLPNGKFKDCRWNDLSFTQMINFYTFYANSKLKSSGGNVSREESRKMAAQDLLMLAILCDWYKHYPEAVNFAKSAVKMSPELEKEANLLMLGGS